MDNLPPAPPPALHSTFNYPPLDARRQPPFGYPSPTHAYHHPVLGAFGQQAWYLREANWRYQNQTPGLREFRVCTYAPQAPTNRPPTRHQRTLTADSLPTNQHLKTPSLPAPNPAQRDWCTCAVRFNGSDEGTLVRRHGQRSRGHSHEQPGLDGGPREQGWGCGRCEFGRRRARGCLANACVMRAWQAP